MEPTFGLAPLRRTAATAAATIGLALAFAGSASAAVFTPTTFLDEEVNVSDCPADVVETSSDADCSLREAMVAANAVVSDDEVVLAAGRYELDPVQGPLRSDRWVDGQEGGTSGTLLVRGAGARATTVDGNATAQHQSRVFRLGQGSTVELRDLGVTGGFVTGSSNGGAIEVLDRPDAVVTMRRVHLFGNASENDGGALSNSGKLTLAESLVSDNSARGSGGGIENDDELTLVNTTISGNSALGNADWQTRNLSSQGQEDFQGNGGGIDNDGDSADEGVGEVPGVIASNSTIAFNHAAGGGGGISTAIDEFQAAAAAAPPPGAPRAIAYFHNTVVSDNTADSEANCSGNFPVGSAEQTSSQGYNLEDGDSCEFGAATDRNAASGLAALADNGGGTDTHKLNDGSVAIDGGDPSVCQAVDQRGVARPQRARCDIGAFEREPVPLGVLQLPTQHHEQPEAPPVIAAGCRDGDSPLSTLRLSGLTVDSSGVTLRGRSRDPGTCPSGVQRVEVSMAKVSGTGLNCRFLRRSNRFVITPFRDCRRPIRFTAQGTTRWSFVFGLKLEPGKYRAQARAYDVRRHKETPTKGRNIIFFTVR
jgi:hypothetical protein